MTSKNASNQEINRVEYNYDAEDHLVRRRVFLNGSGTPSEQRVFVYENGQVALQFDKSASGNLATADLNHRYLWGPAVDQLLADEDLTNLTSPGTVLWPLTDHLGTVRDWLNSSGAVLDHVEYDSFGRRIDTAAKALVALRCAAGYFALSPGWVAAFTADHCPSANVTMFRPVSKETSTPRVVWAL